MKNAYKLSQEINVPIVDYNQLVYLLAEYASPRKKISDMLAKGELIRIKKGLYVFNQSINPAPYPLELLANLIYGPSAISMRYALDMYGFIPEKVVTMTSITSKRNKEFITPLGKFTYQHLNPLAFSIGIKLQIIDNKHKYFIATPEKALCDLITLHTDIPMMNSLVELNQFIEEDMRLDCELLKKLDVALMCEIRDVYNNKKLSRFCDVFLQWRL